MNTTHRFLSGIVSSVLLAVGLARLAARLDPLSRHQVLNATPSGATADSTLPCYAEARES